MTKNKFPTWLGYIIYPLVFVIITAVILTALFGPTVKPYIGLIGYMVSSKTETPPSDLFTGISEDIAKSGIIARSSITYPQNGDMYGNITIAGTSVNAPLYYGDATKQLNNGAGTYVNNFGAGIPGESKTILVGGHNNTFFNGLQDVEVGDIVSVNTNYGRYEYEIVKTDINSSTNPQVYDFTRTDENLILYTCYPFDALGLTPLRYYVYADYVSGPVIDAAS